MGPRATRHAPWALAFRVGALVGLSEGGELNLTLELDDTCGVTHRITGLGMMEETGELACGYEMITNCTMSYYPMRCPEGCPFLAPSFEFACMFKCVRRCSDYNPERPLPDHDSKECRTCHVQNCMECETVERCRVCHVGFGCSVPGGCRDREDCALLFDRDSHLSQIVAVLALAALLLVLFGILWYCIKGPHQNWRMHQASIHRALRHRHLSKVQKWQINDTQSARKWYNLFVNVHEDNIVGVGLALFYNDIVFMALIALIMYGLTLLIEHTIFPREILSHFENRWTRTAPSQIANYHLPVQIDTALGICAYREDMDNRLEDFALKKCCVLAVTFVLMFLISLRFGKFQVSWARKFHDRHVTMRDYAIRVTGLPTEETDEGALRRWFQDELRRAGDLGRPRPRPAEQELHDDGLDTERPRPDTAVEVAGVSICYAYHDEHAEVDDVLWNLIEHMEVKLHNEAVDLLSQVRDDDGDRRADHNSLVALRDIQARPRQEDRQRDNEVPFDDRHRAGRRRPALPLLRHMALLEGRLAEHRVRGADLRDHHGEPQWLPVLEPAHDSHPHRVHEEVPHGCLRALREHHPDSLLDVRQRVSIVAYMVQHQTDAWDDLGWNGFFNPSLKSLGTSVLLAQNVYHFMYPGTFFMGLIMTALNAGPVIMVWKHFLQKVIYVWRCLPDCLLRLIKPMLPWAPPTLEHYPFRSAELGQDPWEIAILGNYADHIVTPTLCFLLLLTTGSTINETFLGMLQWAAFEYVYFRWLHLRYSKKCFYVTGALDSWAKVLWGIPLSVLPVASCIWGYRAHLLPFEGNNTVRILLLVAVYNLSLWLWVVTYRLYCHPFVREETRHKNRRFTFQELKHTILYSWLNCNPIFVLKSQYYFKDENDVNIDARLKDHPIACGIDEKQVRYYERGKEYLFVKPDRQHLVDVDVSDPMEFEYYLEALYGGMDVGRRYVGKELSQYAEQVATSVREMELDGVPLLSGRKHSPSGSPQ